ncbi:hypothetical protein [Candidatus Lokiarchaeum ossiferum]
MVNEAVMQQNRIELVKHTINELVVVKVDDYIWHWDFPRMGLNWKKKN